MKAQAAMEYLMTYGWAILIIVVVLAALVMMIGPGKILGWVRPVAGGFNVISSTPSPGAWSLLTDGSFTLKLSNKAGQKINITNVAVKQDTTSCTVTEPAPYSVILTDQEFTIRATCERLLEGTSYKVEVTINFIYMDTGQPGIDTGSVSGKVARA